MKKFAPLLLSLLLVGCWNKASEPEVSGSPVEQEVVRDDIRGEVKKMACDDLADPQSRQDCTVQVNDIISNLIFREATHTYDISRCGVLPEYMVEQCREAIEKSGIKGPLPIGDYDVMKEALRPTVERETNENGEIIGEPVLSYDISKCDALDTSSGMAQYCKDEISKRIDEERLRDIIRNGGSVEDCDHLSTPDFVTECKLSFS